MFSLTLRFNVFLKLFFIAVCGTTGKRKACKDCSCGLAEELNGAATQPKTANSSCGSVRTEKFNIPLERKRIG